MMKRLTCLTRFLIIFLLSVSLFVPSVGAAEKSFTDYQSGNFGFDSVSYLVNGGIIQGYQDNSFKPTKQVNRAETAIMFQRAFKLKVPVNGVRFNDVPESSTFAEAAAAVKAAGIFKGTSNGSFGPSDLLTREQMASVLVRAFGLIAKADVTVNLNDLSKVSSAHVNDVKILYQNGITNGKENGLYDPKGSVSRAEFSVFMHRALIENPIPQQEEQLPSGQQPAGQLPGGQLPLPGGGGPQPGGAQAELKVTSTALTTTDKVVNGAVSEGNGIVSITYGLENVSGQARITAGTISVSANSTLSLTNFPSAIAPFFSGGVSQNLTQGGNSLSFAAKISSVDLSTIRLLGNFQVGGTLADSEGNSKQIVINYVVN